MVNMLLHRIMNFRYLLLASLSAAAAIAAPCESLAQLKLADTTITLAEAVDAGALVLPASSPARPGDTPFAGLPALCRVQATLRPSPDSEIKIEVWMPAAGWNGKFMGVGNGGWAGRISTPAMAAALKRGYATASTDTGHEGGGGASFAMGHPEKLVDFAYRAVHEMTVKAKAIVSAFYGEAPRYSYWNGCSTGGRQGLKEAQRYPADYDGIIAGAPANHWVRLMTGIIWAAQATHESQPGNMSAKKLSMLHAAVLRACDADDGVKDGVLEDPTRCRFDPGTLECKNEDNGECLTSAQVAAARKMYSHALNPRTGQKLYPGMVRGSELGWDPVNGLQPLGIASSHFAHVVFQNPKWDFRSLNFDSDVALADRLDQGLITATDPNLKPFFDRGGKLLHYHGWNDQQISPINAVDYYESVLGALGGYAKTGSSYRLFMAPGVNHCRGGDGPSNFDAVSVLEQWVESNKPPDRILASREVDGKTVRTRPLCPYPQVAKYKGSGSTDDAANFVCSAP
jgi:feruloyl esterase